MKKALYEQQRKRKQKKEEGVSSIVHFIFSAQEIQTNNIPQSDSDGWEC